MTKIERRKSFSITPSQEPTTSDEVRHLAERTDGLRKRETNAMKDGAKNAVKSLEQTTEQKFPATAEGYMGAFMKSMGFKKAEGTDVKETHPEERELQTISENVKSGPEYLSELRMDSMNGISNTERIQQQFEQDMPNRNRAALEEYLRKHYPRVDLESYNNDGVLQSYNEINTNVHEATLEHLAKRYIEFAQVKASLSFNGNDLTLEQLAYRFPPEEGKNTLSTIGEEPE